MKTKSYKRILALLMLATLASLLAGCETDYDNQRAASVSPDFPPAAPNPLNTPALQASGAAYQR